MADTLVTYLPDGTVIREPIHKPGSMKEAFDRLQRGRRPPRPADAGQGCQPARFHNGAMWWRD